MLSRLGDVKVALKKFRRYSDVDGCVGEGASVVARLLGWLLSVCGSSAAAARSGFMC